MRQQAYPDRLEFALKLGKVTDGETEAAVRTALGKPDHVRGASEMAGLEGDAIWCYGQSAPSRLATLGEVCFRKGRVYWSRGGIERFEGTLYPDAPPDRELVWEAELRSALDALYTDDRPYDRIDTLHLLRAANRLIPLGRERALAIVAEYGRVHDPAVDEAWLFMLLRAIFEVPEPPGYMPEMFIGAIQPPPPTDKRVAPRYPVFLVADVPLTLFRGVELAGAPEPIRRYAREYAGLALRTKPFRPPDDPFTLIDSLHASAEWKAAGAVGDDALTNEQLVRQSILDLVRSAYKPSSSHIPTYELTKYRFGVLHEEFLRLGAHWDEQQQLYVRRDGSHDDV